MKHTANSTPENTGRPIFGLPCETFTVVKNWVYRLLKLITYSFICVGEYWLSVLLYTLCLRLPSREHLVVRLEEEIKSKSFCLENKTLDANGGSPPPPTESCITTALVILFYFYSTRSCIPYWDKITNKKWRGRDSDYINHGIISTNTKRLLLYKRSYVSVGCSDCVEHTKTVCHVHKRYAMECIDLLWHKANRLCWPFLGSTRNACSFWYKSSGN